MEAGTFSTISGLATTLLPIGLMVGVMLFLMYRENRQKEDKEKKLASQIIPGVSVVINGTFIGTVIMATDQEVFVRIGTQEVRVKPSAITEILS